MARKSAVASLRRSALARAPTTAAGSDSLRSAAGFLAQRCGNPDAPPSDFSGEFPENPLNGALERPDRSRLDLDSARAVQGAKGGLFASKKRVRAAFSFARSERESY